MPTHTQIKASAVSRDHTEIAYWTSGDGPPIVLVHGTPADHTRWRPLLPYLERQVTVHAIDRRGRGGSGDAPEYSLEREYEDVAPFANCSRTGSPSAGADHYVVPAGAGQSRVSGD
jgi:pimeloyl-ACP methyl ester carboxylesterase